MCRCRKFDCPRNICRKIAGCLCRNFAGSFQTAICRNFAYASFHSFASVRQDGLGDIIQFYPCHNRFPTAKQNAKRQVDFAISKLYTLPSTCTVSQLNIFLRRHFPPSRIWGVCVLLRGWACRPPVNNLSSFRPDTSPSLKTAIYQLPFSTDFFARRGWGRVVWGGKWDLFSFPLPFFSLERNCLLPACRRPPLTMLKKKKARKAWLQFN